jgi:hypothetical protein
MFSQKHINKTDRLGSLKIPQELILMQDETEQ